MRSINALRGSDLARDLGKAHRAVLKETREWSGADGEPVKAAARALRSVWRRLLSRRSDDPSAPGQSPLAKTRRLARSISHGVVDGVRRVGSGNFVARLLEFGTSRGVEPRPHARPALEEAASQMVDVYVSDAQRRIAQGSTV